MPTPLRPPQESDQDLDDFLDRSLARIGRAGDPPVGTVSVWYGAVDGVPRWTHHAEEQHYAASTMKLPLLVAAYRRHERGEIDLDAAVAVHDRFVSAADGSAFSLDRADDQDDDTWAAVGGTATLRRLARRSIVVSGNLATNLLLEHVGAGEVATVLADAGCSGDTVLPRGIGDVVARDSGLDNQVTAADLAAVMTAIARRTLAEPATCEAIEAVLSQQRHRDKIAAGLPGGVYVANKTGWVAGVAHDVALVRPGDAPPYVLAVCTTLDLPEAAANDLISGLSRRIWEVAVA